MRWALKEDTNDLVSIESIRKHDLLGPPTAFGVRRFYASRGSRSSVRFVGSSQFTGRANPSYCMFQGNSTVQACYRINTRPIYVSLRRLLFGHDSAHDAKAIVVIRVVSGPNVSVA
jgi:hypothetical protein